MDKQKGASTSIQWSSLPRDLLPTIAKRLPTHTDLRHFRAVCSSWRSSIPPPPKSSLKIPFLPYLISTRNPQLFESTIYCIQPLKSGSISKSWFIKVQENPTEPHKFLLVDPLSKHQVYTLPERMPKTINLLDYKVTEMSKAFSLGFHNPNMDSYRKVVTSSTTVVDDDFIIFALHNGSDNLRAWKMGDDAWTLIDYNNLVDPVDTTRYSDVVFYKGKFYAVSFNGCVFEFVFDSSYKRTEIASVVGRVSYKNAKYLVVSFGELFLLERCSMERINSWDYRGLLYWKVYKLNEEINDWVLVNSLGDRAFFVASDSSFAVSTRDIPGCKRNCIYFEYDFYNKINSYRQGFDCGIYHLGHGTICPLSSSPAYSKFFWPPPTWLKPNPRSS